MRPARLLRRAVPWPRAGLPRWARAFLLLAGLAWAMAAAALLALRGPLDNLATIRAADIAPAGGYAHAAPVGIPALRMEDGGLLLRGRLELLEDGRPLAHSRGSRTGVSADGAGRFVADGGQVVFSATDNTDPRTNGKSYALRANVYTLPLAWAFGLGMALCLGLACWLGLRPGRMRQALTLASASAMLAPPLLLAALLALFLAWAARGWALGHALPLAEFWLMLPELKPLLLLEPHLPHAVLAWTGLCAALAWLLRTPLADRRTARWCSTANARQLRLLALPLILGLLLLDIGCAWGSASLGLYRPEDAHSVSLAGMLPANDGAFYFFDTQTQADTGSWHIFPVRRPVGCALRSLEALVSGQALGGYLIAQAALQALALALACRGVARWRGTWAGVGFFALAYVVARNFLPVTNTEPNGLILACLGMALLAESLRRDDARTHLLFVFTATLALLARPGPVLVLPALLAWTLWRYWPERRRALRMLAAAVLSMALALGLQYALAALYGNPKFLGTTSIWYFMSQDMTVGEAWEKMRLEVGDDFADPAWADKLHAIAMENLRRNPGVLLRRLREGLAVAPRDLPRTLADGYGSVPMPRELAMALVPLMAAGLGFAALRRRARGEASLWVFSLSAILASAIAVYQYEGPRTFMAVYPFLWLLAAAGFCAPERLAAFGTVRGPGPEARGAALLTGALALAMLAAPALAHRLGPHAPQPSLPADLDQPGAQWALLQGGAGLTGFALRPEQTPPDTNIPSLPRETALRITQASPIPLLQALGQAMPPVGRGLVLGYTPLRTPRDRYLFLDAPTELLDRRDVPFWLVRLERAHPFNRGSFSLWRATEARPVSLDGTVHPAPGR